MALVDVEDESILATIFKEAFPDSCRENSEFAQYLAELSSYGIAKLNREPDRLSEERAQILDETQSLAFHNYKTFIQTAECCKEIFQDFQIIEKHVDSMLVKLPSLNLSCNEFLKKAQEINASRKINNQTLLKHQQLLEILEMPQLMDTCVRNGYYEEALELAAHVKRLEKKHANIPVIAKIVEEVKVSMQLMLNQLIHQLRTNVQLPACLRVIGYLRRMDVFTEAELRIKFLQARDVWFQGVLHAIPTDDPYHHINKTIDASRVHLFDIITQYRAIFSDDDSIFMTGKDDRPNESALFYGWVIRKISQFLQTLEQDLERGVGGRLDSLLGQCMYFGLSFSRVGADFRGLVAPIFQRAALAAFSKAIGEAGSRLDEMLESYTLLGTHTLAPSSVYGLSVQSGASLQPPTVLLEFLPLAVYCNNVLNAFNDLRLCAPIAVACDVTTLLEDSLRRAADCILVYHRVDETTFNSQEQEKFGQLCRAFADELVPFLNRCLQALFPPAHLALILGVPVAELSKIGKLGEIDVASITRPMQHLVPAVPSETILSTDPVDQQKPENPMVDDVITAVPADVLTQVTLSETRLPEATLLEVVPFEATPSEATPSEATTSEATTSEATTSEATPSEATLPAVLAVVESVKEILDPISEEERMEIASTASPLLTETDETDRLT